MDDSVRHDSDSSIDYCRVLIASTKETAGPSSAKKASLGMTTYRDKAKRAGETPALRKAMTRREKTSAVWFKVLD